MNNGEKIIDPNSLSRPTGAAKNPIFYLKVVYGEYLLMQIESVNEYLQFLLKPFFEKGALAKNAIFKWNFTSPPR